jgi:hypothetical protein
MPVNDLINRSLELYPYTFPNLCARVCLGDRFIFVHGDHTLTTTKGYRQIKHGTRLLVNPSEYHAGLKPGSADRIGFADVVITPDMVGQSIAVFASIELKTNNDSLADNQRDWFRFVRAHNGIAEILKETKDGYRRITEV